MGISLNRFTLIAALVAVTVSLQAQANHLVFSEIGLYPANQVDDKSSEFVEIFNPTNFPVSLDNYYLTDTNNSSLMPVQLFNKVSGATTDHLLRFPAGFTLAPGQVAVVCGGGAEFITDFFAGNKANYDALSGAPLLFEVGQTSPDVPDMISLNNHATRPLNYSLTNAGAATGEFSVLFYWDGAGETFTDVDIATWGTLANVEDANRYKGKIAPFVVDAGSHPNLSISNSGDTLIRTNTTESGEVTSNGNGIGGHDETTENGSAGNWTPYTGRSANMTPGISLLSVSNANVAPVVNSITRDKTYPSNTDTIKLTANITDVDGTVASVKIFAGPTSAALTEYTATPVGNDFSITIGPFSEHTEIGYYVEATDNQGTTVRVPAAGAASARKFYIHNNPATSAGVVVNEILYDVIGTDTYEWVELHNPTNQPVSLAHVRVRDDSTNYFVFPNNAVLPANGYVVLSYSPTNMANDFTIPAGVDVYQYPFSLANSVDYLLVEHLNNLKYTAPYTNALDWVPYTNSSPWPVTNSNVTGRSIELNSPSLDNAVGSNWTGHPALVVEGVAKNSGTPGALNSMLSNVDTWELY